MKAKFSRRVPFFIMSDEEATDSEGFDAYPIEVDSRTVYIAQALRDVAGKMNAKFDNMPAPEEGAQEEAEYFEDLIKGVIDEYTG